MNDNRIHAHKRTFNSVYCIIYIYTIYNGIFGFLDELLIHCDDNDAVNFKASKMDNGIEREAFNII